MGRVITTEHFWDCNCVSDYIHPKTERTCSKCGAVHEDQPDSHIEEAIAFMIKESIEDRC